MANKNCPKCGEKNPAGELVCWACYSNLSSTEERSGLQQRVPDWVVFSGIGLLISSGWLPRRMKWPAATVGLTAIGGVLCWDKWRSQRQHEAEIRRLEAEKPKRLADTILFYAFRDGATAIRLEKRAHTLQVDYRIEGEWQQQMNPDGSLWPGLRGYFQEKAGVSESSEGSFELTQSVRVQREVRLMHEKMDEAERLHLELH